MRKARSTMRAAGLVLGVVLGLALALAPAPAAASAAGPGLVAGAGRADVTPPTGYYLMGWVRSDSYARGQHTRLFARTIVLERANRRLALVAVDLGSIPEGLVLAVADRVRDLGYTNRDLIVSASHTHSAPAGYFNFPAYNTITPTITTPLEFELGGEADPQLYSFLARQIARSIRRAHGDRGPALAGWGQARLGRITQNRSLEAHLANYGIEREPKQGHVHEAPGGYRQTINPAVDVLRVDKLRGNRRVPIGMWSKFANHGTVVKPDFMHYSADHHASATRVAERMMRRRGRVPGGQEVVNAYGNSDEGDMSSGLDRDGPAAAERIGRIEARAMVRAWQRAGRGLERRPALARRWTRLCFCGQQTAVGAVASNAIVGMPFLTGSEENRGPLYDITGIPFEGVRNPVAVGPHGHKLPGVPDPGAGIYQQAVPLTVARVGRQAIATIPGEMTVAMGRSVRRAVTRELRGAGVGRVSLSGLANDFLQYFTTPLEYDRQHYEGGSTIYGRASSVLLEETLAELASRLAAGRPAPSAHDSDPTNGLADAEPPFASGATRAAAQGAPDDVARLEQAAFRWAGGPQGLDRPLDRAFVSVERRDARGRWRTVADDLGMQVIWTVADDGGHLARWEVPRSARTGRHRFVVTANNYVVRSAAFSVRHSRGLALELVRSGGGEAVVVARYPRPRADRDITARPVRAVPRTARASASAGAVRVRTVGKRVVVRGRPGSRVTIPAGGVRDAHGNRNAEPLEADL